ncbi:BnaC02g33950D [Brassica napus]|uniref:BnaC02g33950D protein n=1 Tax=Brassica napus TaxID=3708 RepID=A0A078IHD2_BRANA|nr:BnaC02g33950D [Brassica napus]
MMIRFGESTSFDEITEPAIPIGVESFRFRDHSELLGLANTNTQLPGTALLICKFFYYDYLFNNNHTTNIVGEITAVKSTVTDPPQNNNRLMATIKMDKLLVLPYLSI